jgi:hypothetical protein
MSKNINIYDLLKNGDHKDIKEHLLYEIYKIASYCTETIGEGYFGKVSIPANGPYISVKIDENYYTVPIVVKEAKNVGNVYIDTMDDDLIINSDNGITCEAIMLFIISKLWYKGINLHLPFMVGMGSCDSSRAQSVTHILLERHGMFNPIELKRENYVPMPNQLFGENTKMTRLVTIIELSEYMSIHADNNFKCKLPNDTEVYLPDIIDNFCIFYLHTSYFLWENLGLTLSDQHMNNIYVHWINDMSKCGKRSINEVEHIFYEIGKDKYIKVKTFGLIFKIGDIGCSVMNIQNNVMIVGDLARREKLKDIKVYKKRHSFYVATIEFALDNFPREIINKTKIFSLLNSNKILSKYIPYIGFTEKLDKSAPTELELLNDKIYDDMKSSNIVDDVKNFVIKMKI